MNPHFIISEIDDKKLIYWSAELGGVLEHLKTSEKIIGIVYANNEYKVIETDEFFDATKYETLRNNLTIIIDRNLLITARELYELGYLKTHKHTFFTSLLAYAIFTDALFDPTIAIYEGGDKNNLSALEDINRIRIVDNLKFDTILDLLFGRIQNVTDVDWNEARNKTKELEKNTVNEDFNKALTLFKENYPYMLKATILLRIQGLSLYHKIKMFFQWIMEEFIIKSDASIFTLYCFYKNGGILKDFNTNDFNRLIHSVKNATWDVTCISFLKNQAKKKTNRYFLFTTDDKNLLTASKYYFTHDITTVNKLFGSKSDEVNNIIKKMNEMSLSPDRDKLIIERYNKIDSIIYSLEKELEQSISTSFK